MMIPKEVALKVTTVVAEAMLSLAVNWVML
jgi:hypothetical protein